MAQNPFHQDMPDAASVPPGDLRAVDLPTYGNSTQPAHPTPRPTTVRWS